MDLRQIPFMYFGIIIIIALILFEIHTFNFKICKSTTKLWIITIIFNIVVIICPFHTFKPENYIYL